MKRSCLLFAIFCGTAALFAARVEVDPANAVITAGADGAMYRFAAGELQKHLALVCGKTIPIVKKGEVPPGKFCLTVGGGDGRQLKPEEAIWIVDAKGIRVFGDDDAKHASTEMLPKRAGTLHALYDMLEKNFGFMWLFPGDAGICHYKESPVLAFEEGEHHWVPAMVIRGIRPAYGQPYRIKMPKGMEVSKESTKDVVFGNQLWMKRQRMGRSEDFGLQHAFTRWWGRFSKTHPDYFALQPDGSRGPGSLSGDRVKICVSNPAVADQIVEDWKNSKVRPKIINVTENDSGNYCTCAGCQKLDVVLPGEKPMAHLTDRYVHLANEVLKRAEKINPEVGVGMYAYSIYLDPPRREKVSSKMVIGIVSSMFNNEKNRKRLEGWYKAGLRKVYLRPNDHHANIILPIGIEKMMYDHFRITWEFGMVGTDYDSMYGFWPTTGIADYILARAHIDPNRSFEKLEAEYYSAYGPAAPEVREFFRYWRQEVLEKRIMPDRERIAKVGLYGNFSRGLLWNVGDYFKPEDFDKTDAILRKALAKPLSPTEKKLVNILLLGNRHSRLTYQALTAPKTKKEPYAIPLIKFRKEHKNDLPMFWMMVNFVEQRFGDLTGAGVLSEFSGYSKAERLNSSWHFKMDEKNVGLKEHWEKTKARDFKKWPRISILTNWEKQKADKNLPAELVEKLRDYDGIGWYAWPVRVPKEWKGKEVYLYFGAVDESAWVYVNGKLAGENVTTPGGDQWKTPFFIRLDPVNDWDRNYQDVVVRVQDDSGVGGIWRPVYLLCK